jgi:hypothetical protein
MSRRFIFRKFCLHPGLATEQRFIFRKFCLHPVLPTEQGVRPDLYFGSFVYTRVCPQSKELDRLGSYNTWKTLRARRYPFFESVGIYINLRSGRRRNIGKEHQWSRLGLKMSSFVFGLPEI